MEEAAAVVLGAHKYIYIYTVKNIEVNAGSHIHQMANRQISIIV